MRWTPAEGWYLLARHLARLEHSARHFGFPFSPQTTAAAVDAVAAAGRGPLRVRLLLARDGSVRTEHVPLDWIERRLTVRLASEPIDPTDDFLFHKTTNRAPYDRMRRPDCDDVILWNPAGEVTESTIMNLVVERDGRRVTPPVECGLLPGTMRAELLATGAVSEARVTIEQARSADRFWLVNSVRGWCAANWGDA
jgi:branched-subunit amino acid aminotransferase/4-amino-4-deoxychorismate lyase